MANPISNLGIIPTLTVAGRTFTDLDNLLVFTSYLASNGFSGLVLAKTGSTAYQVTGGKTLTLEAVQVKTDATTSFSYRLGWGTAAVAGSPPFDAASAPTGATYQNGSGTTATVFSRANINAFNGANEFYTKFDIAATRYPFVQGTASAATIVTYGYETG